MKEIGLGENSAAVVGLNERGLGAAFAVAPADWNARKSHLEIIKAAITAYLSASLPADVAGLVERLRDPDYRNEMQHLRDWRELDAMHSEAATALASLSAAHPGWRDMASAPLDGTKIIAILYRETCEDMDGVKRAAFSEIREIWFRPYTQFGMFLPWHAGDPFDSHEGMAPDHFGEAVPIAWLPRAILPPAPALGGE